MHRFIHQMKSPIPKQILRNIFFWSENIIIFIKLNLWKFSWLYQNRTIWNKLEEAKITLQVIKFINEYLKKTNKQTHKQPSDMVPSYLVTIK